MRLRIVLVRVVQVVRREQRNPEIFRNLEQLLLHATLDLEAMIHDLAEEVFFTEDALKLGCGLSRLLVLAEAQAGVNLTRWAAGRGDKPLGVLMQQLAIGSGLEVVALDAGS